LRSFIRWAGSKRQALRHLRPFWTGNGARYIEPFAGSCSLFFDIQPNEAVLGDINTELIRALRAVQREVGIVLECFRRLPKSRQAYYALRRVDPGRISEAECAARFIYLNRYCFNGLYRTNAKGEFNVPYARPRGRVRLDEDLLTGAARALARATLVNGDFQNTLIHARRGDFVYLDPPYVTSSRRVFSEYLPGTFEGRDLERLGGTLRELNSGGVTFVITYADSPEARTLLKSWNTRRIRTRRNIAGFSARRRGAYELVATNTA
jgi:DNA adenine methylase